MSECKTEDIAVAAARPAVAMKDLLVFAYYFPPCNESGAQRPFRFVKYLARCGYRPHVVTRRQEGRPAWNSVWQTDELSDRSWAAAAGRILRSMERVLPYRDQLPWTPRAIAKARQVAALHPVSAIFSTSPPAGAHLAALWCKKTMGIPWIADFRDPICGNPFRTLGWGRPYDAALERIIVANADAVIANTEASAGMLRRRYRPSAGKIHLIWNGFDEEDELGPLPLRPGGPRVLLHAGTIYGGRHPGALLESMKRLFAQGRLDPGRVHLRLIGTIEPNQPWLRQTGFDELVARGWVEHTAGHLPREEAKREMAQADYLLLLDLNELGAGVQVPAKLFEYIRVGRPILAFTTEGSGVERVLAGAGVPHVCIYKDTPAEEMDRKLLSFFELPVEAVRPSRWFEEQFNARNQTEVLRSLLCSLER